MESLKAKLEAYQTASGSHAQDRPGKLEATVGPDDAAQLVPNSRHLQKSSDLPLLVCASFPVHLMSPCIIWAKAMHIDSCALAVWHIQ